MCIKPAKIVEEWIFIPQSTNTKVRGRITFTEGELFPYIWEISHFYFLPGNGVNTPEVTQGKSVEETRTLLFSYAESINTAVEVNQDF